MWSLGFVNRCDRMVEDFRITMEPISINTLTAITAKHIFLVSTQGSTPSTVLHINTRHFYFCLIFNFFKIFGTKTALNFRAPSLEWSFEKDSMERCKMHPCKTVISKKSLLKCLVNCLHNVYHSTPIPTCINGPSSKITQDNIGILWIIKHIDVGTMYILTGNQKRE